MREEALREEPALGEAAARFGVGPRVRSIVAAPAGEDARAVARETPLWARSRSNPEPTPGGAGVGCDEAEGGADEPYDAETVAAVLGALAGEESLRSEEIATRVRHHDRHAGAGPPGDGRWGLVSQGRRRARDAVSRRVDFPGWRIEFRKPVP